MKQSQKIVRMILLYVYSFLEIAGMLLSFCFYIPVFYQKKSLWTGIVLCCLFVPILLYRGNNRPKRAGVFMGNAGLLLLLLWKWKLVFRSFLGILQSCIVQVNHVYQTEWIMDLPNKWISSDATAGLLLLAGIGLLILEENVLKKRPKVLLIVVCLLPLEGALFLDTVPPMHAMVCQVLGMLGLWTLSGVETEKRAVLRLKVSFLVVFAAGILSVIAATGAGVTEDMLQSANKKVQSYINETVIPAFMNTAQTISEKNGYVGNVTGELKRTGGPSYTGAEVLSVYMEKKPADTLYLKGFVGDSYTGTEWTAVSERMLPVYAGEHGWNMEPDFLQEIFNLSYQLNSASGEEHPTRMKIQPLMVSGEQIYYPYSACLEQNMFLIGDGAVKGYGEQDWNFLTFPVETGNLTSVLKRSAVREQNERELQYRAYVYDTYLHVPVERLPRLWQDCQEHPAANAEEAAERVRERMAPLTYNLRPGNYPEDQDFTEYFLYDKKEGYCVHFATAAVLMFRMYGVPARYVSGYIVPGDSFYRNKDGLYEAEIRDDKAHAWAEIYIPSYGWFPVDPTPVDVNSGQHADAWEGETPQVTAAETPSVLQTQTPAVSGKTPGAVGATTEEQEESFWSAGKVVLLLVLLLGFLPFAWRAVMLSIQRMRWRESPQKAIVYTFTLICRLLKADGFLQELSPDSPEFQIEILKRYRNLDEQTLQQSMDLVMEAGFGNRDFSKKEVMEVRRTYRKICSSIYEKKSWIGKLRMRVVNVYF